jgi:hypothetical protein
MTKDDAASKDVFAEKTTSRHEPVTENPNAAKTGGKLPKTFENVSLHYYPENSPNMVGFLC